MMTCTIGRSQVFGTRRRHCIIRPRIKRSSCTACTSCVSCKNKKHQGQRQHQQSIPWSTLASACKSVHLPDAPGVHINSIY